MLDIREDEESYITLAEGKTAREVSARQPPASGGGRSSATWSTRWCDSELMDNIDYTLFPNMHPWGALQPHRVPLPAQRRRPPQRDHGRVSCSRRSRASGRRRAATTISAPTTSGPTPPSSACSAKVFEQDSSTCRRCSTAWRATRQARHHAGQLPGVEDALAARSARRE